MPTAVRSAVLLLVLCLGCIGQQQRRLEELLSARDALIEQKIRLIEQGAPPETIAEIDAQLERTEAAVEEQKKAVATERREAATDWGEIGELILIGVLGALGVGGGGVGALALRRVFAKRKDRPA